MIDFSQVKQIIAPFGEIIKIQNVIGDVLWSKLIKRLYEWRGLSPLTCTPTIVDEFNEVKVYGQSKQGILPDGYTQLECTKNTDDVYIDTGIVPSDNTILKIRFRPTTKLGSNYIFGSRAGSNTPIYGIGGASSGARINISYAGNNVTSDIVRELNTIYDIEASFINGVATLTVTDEKNNVTDIKSVTYTWAKQNTTFKFYGFNSFNCISTGTEVFEVEIIQDGVSVYHAYPCKQGEEVGFYDVIGNTFTSKVNLSAGNTVPSPTTPIEVESVGDRTKNLFDINAINVHSFLYSVTGKPQTSTTAWGGGGYAVSDYIPVKPNTTYTKSGFNAGTTSFYDINKNFITFGSYNVELTTPENCYYIRTNVKKDYNNTQLEEGNTATSYEPYGKYKVPVEVSGKNLFDYTKHTYINSRVMYDDGTIPSAGGSWQCFEDYWDIRNLQGKYISVNGNTTGSGTGGWCFYDENKQYIIGYNGTFQNILVPNNAVYARGCWLTTQASVQDIQVELGTQSTSYQPYTEPTTTNIYLNEPLRKIGEYADTLSVDGTDVTVVRNVEEIDNTGTKPIEESLIHKVPFTTETYTIESPIIALDNTSIITVDTTVPPSEVYASEYVEE